ncbi:hypothetical protein ACFYO0_12405 [Streptomyces sp. NPDC006365]|uniref:hypothetical protein n=1 Tax=Streptomyces sp. NPDC006365 TaxID=3364744 RepID=UPI0036C897B2
MFDEDGTLLSSPTGGSEEYVDLTEPGTYEVYVDQFGLPDGATGQTYTPYTWLIGQDSRPAAHRHPGRTAGGPGRHRRRHRPLA